MKICESYKTYNRPAERAPVAVPAGLLLMGLLVMTFESTMALLLGFLLSVWGAVALTLRATELACCMKSRRKKLERGERAPSCLPI